MAEVKRQSTESQDAPETPSPVIGRRPIRIRRLNAVAIVMAAVLALFALVNLEHVFESERQSEEANLRYHACSSAARDLQEASDYLTSQVRVYVSTGDRTYMDAYMTELLETDRRGRAVETLRENLGDDSPALRDLEEALEHSNELAVRELYAMRLTAEATGLADLPELVAEVNLDAADLALAPADQRNHAEQIVLGGDYQTTKDEISSSVGACRNNLLGQLDAEIEEGNTTLRTRLLQMQGVIIVLLGIVVFVIFATIFLILWPLATYSYEIKHDERLILTGASELRYLADAYNAVYEENRERTQSLRHAAERDALTGLYNRGAYDALLEEHQQDMALLLVDVDELKDVNDTYGHDTGDAVLKKVGSLLVRSFRGTDYACRIGGDEFAVIMTGVDSTLRHVVERKVEDVAAKLRDTSDGLPDTTVSVGIAFSESLQPGGLDIYRAADSALYVVKERGRNGHAFYGEA